MHDEYLPNASQPWTHPKWNGHWGMLCKVLSVEYQFPPSTTEGTKSIICKVDLKALEGIVGGRRATEYVNGIHKRPLPATFTFHVYVGEVGQPDFLVLRNDSLKRSMRIWVCWGPPCTYRIRKQFTERLSKGVLRKIKSTSILHIHLYVCDLIRTKLNMFRLGKSY